MTINSPMVGTFYRAPSPEAEAFVQEGQIVEPGQELCIIEAMKLMNTIESDIRGRILKIMVEKRTTGRVRTTFVLNRKALMFF